MKNKKTTDCPICGNNLKMHVVPYKGKFYECHECGYECDSFSKSNYCNHPNENTVYWRDHMGNLQHYG